MERDFFGFFLYCLEHFTFTLYSYYTPPALILVPFTSFYRPPVLWISTQYSNKHINYSTCHGITSKPIFQLIDCQRTNQYNINDKESTKTRNESLRISSSQATLSTNIWSDGWDTCTLQLLDETCETSFKTASTGVLVNSTTTKSTQDGSQAVTRIYPKEGPTSVDRNGTQIFQGFAER